MADTKATAYTFRLDYPPSLNHLYRNMRGGRALSKAGLAYKRTAAWQAKAQGVIEPIEGPVAVSIEFYPPAHRNGVVGDLDNLCKALLDSLKGIAWKDDRQVYRIESERHAPSNEPRAEVTICSRDFAGIALTRSRALRTVLGGEIIDLGAEGL